MKAAYGRRAPGRMPGALLLTCGDDGDDASSEVVLDCRNELTVAGVTGEFPEERPAQTLLLHVRHLPGDGRRRVVAPPVAAALGVRGAAHRAGRRAGVLEDLVVLDARLVGARWRSGGRASRGRLADAGPAAAVEADAEQHLAVRDALALELLDV